MRRCKCEPEQLWNLARVSAHGDLELLQLRITPTKYGPVVEMNMAAPYAPPEGVTYVIAPAVEL